jgi:hypothetical protein
VRCGMVYCVLWVTKCNISVSVGEVELLPFDNHQNDNRAIMQKRNTGSFAKLKNLQS